MKLAQRKMLAGLYGTIALINAHTPAGSKVSTQRNSCDEFKFVLISFDSVNLASHLVCANSCLLIILIGFTTLGQNVVILQLTDVIIFIVILL